MIEISNLNKTYNLGKSNSYKALTDISLKVRDGEMVAITGKSGAGKSTLLHIIGCLDNFESGNYKFKNYNIDMLKDSKLAKIRSKEIGFVLQDFGLIIDDTVYQNIKIPMMFDDETRINQIKDKIDIVLKKLDIFELKNKLVRNLSGGQKQRVAIARAIVNNPDLILADEPTGALDNKTTAEIMTVLKELNKQGTTVIIVTHDENVAKYCSREIVISDGRLSSQ